MKTLIADDHPLLRDALSQILRSLDSRVILLEAAEGDAVRRLVQEHPDLDLLLLDLCLPGVRGLDLFLELRRQQPTLPIVAISGIEDPVTVKAVLAGGGMGYIPKSSPPPVMIQALRLVLAGGRYLPPALLAQEAGTPGVVTEEAPAGATPAALGLTARQEQVLHCLVQGLANKEICRVLGLAEATVKIHVSAILKALRVTSRTQAVIRATQLGLGPPNPGAATPPHPRGGSGSGSGS
jgi:DNA-binding NarL/FixJ family response regulator